MYTLRISHEFYGGETGTGCGVHEGTAALQSGIAQESVWRNEENGVITTSNRAIFAVLIAVFFANGQYTTYDPVVQALRAAGLYPRLSVCLTQAVPCQIQTVTWSCPTPARWAPSTLYSATGLMTDAFGDVYQLQILPGSPSTIGPQGWAQAMSGGGIINPLNPGPGSFIPDANGMQWNFVESAADLASCPNPAVSTPSTAGKLPL